MARQGLNGMAGLQRFRDLVLRSRSIRRFDESAGVTGETLRDLAELACYVPSPRNLQPLKFLAVSDPERCKALFPMLGWAGYLPDWPGPEPGERPRGYIVMLGDTSISRDFACDSGIAAEAIMLGASSMGLGGCIIGSLERDGLRRLLRIPGRYELLLVLAIGRPAETVVVDEMDEADPVRYWRDPNGIHHVPKRRAGDIMADFGDDPC
ncbi:nitroreductase family protein [Chlorobium sp. N1]|uniref:nitroreductase family protein n=1 Tax=Chlorobium sp. N1 TaxID=2491138 RepID=UPI00103EB26F|nr:nitroreductase family protein [Chlorobium sp. N1]TCD47626.1 nitroreductase family protein [Chlorobium sp. N1]